MKKEILWLLKGGPVKRKVMLHHLREQGHDVTDRQMRAVIEDMVMVDGYLIESSSHGYSMIQTEDELNRAVDYLNQKAEAIAIRKNSLKRNWEKSKPLMTLTLF